MIESIISYGLAMGAAYALIAVAYNVMFSTSRVFSFTAGALGMLGGVCGALFIEGVLLSITVPSNLRWSFHFLGGAVIYHPHLFQRDQPRAHPDSVGFSGHHRGSGANSVCARARRSLLLQAPPSRPNHRPPLLRPSLPRLRRLKHPRLSSWILCREGIEAGPSSIRDCKTYTSISALFHAILPVLGYLTLVLLPS